MQQDSSNKIHEDDSINQCADILSSLGCTKSAEQLSFLANLLALSISEGKSAGQLNIIGNFISAVGGIVSTIAAQKEFCDSKLDKIKQIRELKKQILDLEDSLLKG